MCVFFSYIDSFSNVIYFKMVGEGGSGVAGGVGECVKCRSEWVLGVNLAFSNRQ